MTLWQGSVTGDLYPKGLGWLLRSSRLYDQDYALRQDPESYEKMRRDPVLGFALHYRKLLAAGREWFLEPASSSPKDRMAAAIMEGLIRRCRDFTLARYNLAEAIIAGSRWGKPHGGYQYVSTADLPPMKWWVVHQIQDVDKRRFAQFPDDYLPTEADHSGLGNSWVNWETIKNLDTSNRKWSWWIWQPLKSGSGAWEKIDTDDWIQHIHDNNEASLGYGSGLASQLWHYWYAKVNILEEWLAYLERWGQGMLIYKLNELRDGFATSAAIATKVAQIQDQIQIHRSKHILVCGALDEVKVVDPPTGGSEDVRHAVEYFDASMRVAILGAGLPTEGKVVYGSYALAKVQENSTVVNSQHDNAILEETITRCLIDNQLWAMNYPRLVALGLGGSNPPHFRVEQGKSDNPKERLDVLLGAQTLGLRLRVDEAYAQLALSAPLEGDPAIEPPLPAASAPEDPVQGEPDKGKPVHVGGYYRHKTGDREPQGKGPSAPGSMPGKAPGANQRPSPRSIKGPNGAGRSYGENAPR